MSRSTFLLFIGALFVGMSSSTAIADSNASDADAIKGLISDFTSAWHKSDARALSMFWTEDGDFINPDGFFMTGRDQIAGFYSQAFSMGYAGTSASATVDKIRFLNPVLAIVDGAFEISGRAAQNRIVIPAEKGRYTALVAKQNGHWWIVSNREMEPLKNEKKPDRSL